MSIEILDNGCRTDISSLTVFVSSLAVEEDKELKALAKSDVEKINHSMQDLQRQVCFVGVHM